jgi:ring-1,2-phenylacetyl-CoA epoxidase subunit PaaE
VTTPHFYPLKIADVRRETADAVSIAFAVPAELRELYRFTPGQFLTLRTRLDGVDLRRSYSICSSADEYENSGELRVAVKRVDGGAFSNWANDALNSGNPIEVMTPDGRFFTRLDPAVRQHYVAFAAGSGITPVIAIIKTTLKREPKSRFTLFYGNRRIETILFAEELEDLKDLHLDRFTLYHVLSREHQEVDLFNGRLDRARVAAFLDTLVPAPTVDAAFVCGPENMIDDVAAALGAAGVAKERIHIERFVAPGEAQPTTPRRAAPVTKAPAIDTRKSAEVEIIADGVCRTLRVPFDGAGILDTALAAGADLPYACKGGVCCTCRARVLEGEVRMDRNFTLEEAEMRQGFVLTCQSHPVTERVVISYDER